MRIGAVSKSMAATLIVLLCALGAAPVSSEKGDSASVAPVLWQPSMNVFRRFSADADEMFEFYGGVLGLEQLQTFDVGGGTSVARFMAGHSEVKLTRRVPGRTYVPGGLDDATGLRLLTFFYPDLDEVVQRFRAHGHDEPHFVEVPGSTRLAAQVVDPDGHAVELVIAPNEPVEVYTTIEIGLTVGDLARSRAFYGDFVGLDELPAVQARLSPSKKVSYRHGTTIVSLHHLGRSVPADSGTGGIQYVVSDVDVVDALARERGVTIDQPLGGVAGFDLRTIWLDDPDGITNYFAETGQSSQARANAAAESRMR
jgi:predicted enzyme related to lactoylglutathione lyase